MKGLVVSAAAVALGLLFSPEASADTPEENFINNLAAQGVHGNDEGLIAVGHQVCGSLRGDLGQQAALGFTIYTTGVSTGEIGRKVFPAAVQEFCPEFK